MSAEDQQQDVLLEEKVSPPSYSDAPPVVVKSPLVSPPGVSRPTDPSLNTVYMAIFAMLFCCWPCGLVGLIYGIQGMQEHYRGQYENSDRTEKRAKKWVICSIVSGVVLVVGIFFFVILVQAVTWGVLGGTGALDENGKDD